MIEEVCAVTHGRGAVDALARTVSAAQRGAPLTPVTVIVPTNFAGLAARRMLGGGRLGGRGIANVAFVTPFRLAELLAPAVDDDRRPLTNAVLGAAVRRTLVDAPGRFATVAAHEATEAALAQLYAELSHVAPAALDSVARAGGLAAEAVRLFRRTQGYLNSFSGEDDLASAAAERPDLGGAVRALGAIIWYLPEPVTPALGRLIGSVLSIGPSRVIVALTGAEEADHGVRTACARAGVAVPDTGPMRPPLADAIVSVTDADEEVRAVVRRIVELAQDGVELARIGVFYPTPDPYLLILGQQFEAAGLPANGPSHDRLAASVAGRTLLAALALPDQRWRRDRVMALVTTGPIHHGEGPGAPAGWERLSRSAGVVQDLGDWRTKLSRTIREAEAGMGADAPPGRIAYLRSQVGQVVELASFVEALAAGVGAVSDGRGWAAKSRATLELLHALLGNEASWQGWPDPERYAAVRVTDAIIRLSELDALDPEPSPEVFLRGLRGELDVARGRAGRFGEGVSYGPLLRATGQDLDAVFVLGMAEGRCPLNRHQDALLPDRAREAALGELPSSMSTMHDQHRALLAALAAAPPGRRVLTFARGDLRGSTSPIPSRWLLPTATELAGRPVYSTDFAELGTPVVDVVPSFSAGVGGARVAATVTERDLAVVSAFCDRHGRAEEHPATAKVRRGLECLAMRRSADFTEWDGNLSAVDVPSPLRGPLSSPTSLEEWAECGFRYFLRRVLGLRDREEPEKTVEISALDRGSAIHVILERFFAGVIARGSIAPAVPWGEEDRTELRRIADEVFASCEATGATGRPVLWKLERTRLTTLLEGFLTADDAFRRSTGGRPVAVEHAFGTGSGSDAVQITLADGRSVQFRGRADRIDRIDDVDGAHTYVVNDYKTGSGDKYRHLDKGDPVQAGTTLQLGVYAEAALLLPGAARAEAYYWLVNDAVRFARPGYPWDEERRRRFATAVSGIVRGIETGAFAAVPGDWDSYRNTNDNCRYCDFDDVCPRDRGEYALVKVDAPQLKVRAVLADWPQ